MTALTPAICVRAGDIVAGAFAPVPVRKVSVQTNWREVPFDGFTLAPSSRDYCVTGVVLSLDDGTQAHCDADTLVPVLNSHSRLSEPSLN